MEQEPVRFTWEKFAVDARELSQESVAVSCELSRQLNISACQSLIFTFNVESTFNAFLERPHRRIVVEMECCLGYAVGRRGQGNVAITIV